MDTLSSSISTFTIPKSNNLKNHLPHHHHPSLKPKTTKLSNKTTSFTAQNHFLPPHINSSRPPSPLKHSSSSKPPEPHQKPSTGYAVALLDAARRHNVVDAVHRDVKRLSKWLRDDQLLRVMADPYMDKTAKGEIVKEVVKKGRFEKHLVKLVKLLAEKCKVDLVRQVLSEFGRIYDELCVSVAKNDQHQLLLLPSGLKMEENHVLAIVGRIQKLTGVDKVAVANYS